MNAKTIAALTGIRDNIDELIKAIDQDSNSNSAETKVSAEAPQEKTPAKKTPATTAPRSSRTKTRKEREDSETIPDKDNLTEESLKSLSYNNLKKLAKEMGLSATGDRAELTAKILGADPSESEEEDDEIEETEEVDETPESDDSEDDEDESEDDDESDEDDDDEDDEPSIADQVAEAVEDMTNEEIMDVLADAGIKAKGKRQSLIDAVVKAVESGKIDLSGDDDDEDEDDEEEEEESEDFDPNDPENPDMTKKRKKALKKNRQEIEDSFEKGEISRKEIIGWLNEFNGTKDSMKKKSDEDLLEEYIYATSLLIDDNGEIPEEEGAYEVNGVPYCCGHELKYNKDNKTYICEQCGAEYEA